eukprot:742077_1
MRPTQMRYGDVMTAWYYYTKLHCGNALLREPAGSSRVSHLSNVIRNELNTIIYDTKITVDIEQIKRSNAILNLVENIQKHESVRKLSQAMFDFQLGPSIDLSINATERCYSYHFSENCYFCDSKLDTIYKGAVD